MSSQKHQLMVIIPVVCQNPSALPRDTHIPRVLLLHYSTGQLINQHLLCDAVIYQLHKLIYGIIMFFDIEYGIPGIITLDYPIITLGFASGLSHTQGIITTLLLSCRQNIMVHIFHGNNTHSMLESLGFASGLSHSQDIIITLIPATAVAVSQIRQQLLSISKLISY